MDSDERGPHAPARPGPLFLTAAGVAIAAGAAQALWRAWLCDDAFICFRYAKNLIGGLGLVFNAGERVEGFTNLLWTLFIAAGMKLGAEPASWAQSWGIALGIGTLALLAVWSRRIGGGLLPIAALLAACHRDLAIWSTGGLETSLLTFLLLLSPLLVLEDRPAAAGLVLALASLTRPDAVLLAATCGAFVALRRPRAAVWRLAAAFLLVWGPATAARVAYYGDFFPNTYYAKSANLAWWSQGLLYVRLYFQKYPLLLAGMVAAPFLALSRRVDDRAREAAALLAVSFLLYATYVARVGGDFMFARLLIPVTPLLLILVEILLARVAGTRLVAQGIAAALVGGSFLAMPMPVSGTRWAAGVSDEWDFYEHNYTRWRAESEWLGGRLRTLFAGLPVRMPFLGAEAALVYYAEPQVAVESVTGLTDVWIAHQPLARRGRVGHEKSAPPGYLLDRRKVNVTFWPEMPALRAFDDWVPIVPIRLGPISGRLLSWEPALVDAFRSRGALIPDFPRSLDAYIAGMGALPDEAVGRDYARFRRFYFANVSDPAREAAFRSRLGGIKASPDGPRTAPTLPPSR